MISSSEPDESSPIVKVAKELFRNFVAYERGVSRTTVLNLIKDRIWPLMNAKEQSELFSGII